MAKKKMSLEERQICVAWMVIIGLPLLGLLCLVIAVNDLKMLNAGL